MAETTNIGLRCPNEILSQIDARVGFDGRNRSDVLITLVKRGLGLESNPGTGEILARLDALEKKLAPSNQLNSRQTI